MIQGVRGMETKDANTVGSSNGVKRGLEGKAGVETTLTVAEGDKVTKDLCTFPYLTVDRAGGGGSRSISLVQIPQVLTGGDGQRIWLATMNDNEEILMMTTSKLMSPKKEDGDDPDSLFFEAYNL